MNTQNLSTLLVFQSVSHNCKSLLFQSCRKELTRFLCKGIVNLLKGNLQGTKSHQVTKSQNEDRVLFSKKNTWKQRGDLLASDKKLQLIKVFTPPIINHLSWHGAVFIVLASVYNKNLNTQSDTKREFPKYQPSQNPTYQMIRLRRK